MGCKTPPSKSPGGKKRTKKKSFTRKELDKVNFISVKEKPGGCAGDEKVKKVIFPHPIEIGTGPRIFLTPGDTDITFPGDFRDGTDGTDGGNAPTFLVNPMSVTLAADSSGVVSDFSPTATSIKVFITGSGSTVDTSLPMDNSTFKVNAIPSSGISLGTKTETPGASSVTFASLSSMSVDQGTVLYSITGSDDKGNTYEHGITQTIAKARRGTNGTNGTDGDDGDDGVGYTAYIFPGSVVVPSTSGGTLDFSNSGATISVFKDGTQLTGVTSGTPGTGEFKVSGLVSSGVTPDSTPSASSNNLVYTAITGMASTTGQITYTLNIENVLTSYKLQQTFAKVLDGADGVDGTSTQVTTVITGSEAVTHQIFSTGTKVTDPPWDGHTNTSAGWGIQGGSSDLVSIDASSGGVSVLLAPGLYRVDGSCFNFTASTDVVDYQYVANLQLVRTTLGTGTHELYAFGQAMTISNDGASEESTVSNLPSGLQFTGTFFQSSIDFVATKFTVLYQVNPASFVNIGSGAGQASNIYITSAVSGSVFGKLEFTKLI